MYQPGFAVHITLVVPSSISIMTNHPISRLTFHEALELAQLAAIFQDLGFVVQATKKLASMLRAGQSDQITERSLFTAALVAYVRCLSSGKRNVLSHEIFSGVGVGVGVGISV